MNIEANRRVHPIQPLPRNTPGFEMLPDLGDPGLAAEHAQVAGGTIVDLLQDGMVGRMAPSDQLGNLLCNGLTNLLAMSS